MKFKVVAATDASDTKVIPATLPAITPLQTTLPQRDLTLHEHMMFENGEEMAPVAALLGTPQTGPLKWMDKVTETPTVGDTEIWRIINLTEDAHPVHLHLVFFQVLDRQAIDSESYNDDLEKFYDDKLTELPKVDNYFGDNKKVSPKSWESGWKDTVIAYPGQVTRIIAKFDLEGLYVWHCHILEHEDNEMMRPYRVLPKK